MDTSHDRKTLTAAAVYEAAETLMTTHGITTTLEVKNRLRNDGFWALQADVSRLMWLLAREVGWFVCSNGRHRLYALEPFQPHPQPAPVLDTYVGRFWMN
jgi:arginine repressor